jgi:hypothetical protein
MVVYENEPFTEVIRRFLAYPELRTTLIVALGGKFRGIVTRGDVRRMMRRGGDAPFTKSAIELCNANPKVVFDTFDTEPSKISESHNTPNEIALYGIGLCDIPVVSKNGTLLGFVAMKDKYEAFANYFKTDAATGMLKQIPTMVFSELPKSAGTYITMSLAKNLGIERAVLLSAYSDISISEKLSQVVFQNSVLQTHYNPGDFFRERLSLFLPKLIVHIRDPRATVLSLIYHSDGVNTLQNDPAYYRLHYVTKWGEKTFDEKLSYMLDTEINFFLGYLRQVIEVQKTGRSDVMFTTFEEFVLDNDAFFKKILDFYDIPWSYWQGKNLRKASNVRFRKGSVDEWRSAFTREQIDRINAKIPDEFFDAFGWER